MRAHRAKVHVDTDHIVRIQLPSDFPAGDAEVIVLVGPSEEASRRGERLSVDELLAARLTPGEGIGPVTLEDMERAIQEAGAQRGGV